MKKFICLLLIVMMMFSIVPVHAVTYLGYEAGDEIIVKVNDNTEMTFLVMKDSKATDTKVVAIAKDVVEGKYNFTNAKGKIDALKTSWTNVVEVKLPSMADIFGSEEDYLTNSFPFENPSWALSDSRYWTSTIQYAQTFGEKILEDNTAKSDSNIDFSKSSYQDGTKGLYYTNKNTEGGKTTYYFRGDVKNNYVKFGKYAADVVRYRGYESDSSISMWTEYATLSECQNANEYNVNCKAITYAKKGDDMYYRIVRINEDGSIRLLYQGTSVGATLDNATIGVVGFNSQSKDNAYVGYMYGTVNANSYNSTHANQNNSTVKDYLDSWYRTNLSSYSSYIADAGFCNDRSITNGNLGYGKNTTYYAAVNRLETLHQPQFKCPNEANDLFTTSKSSKGNKALTYAVAMLTADEFVYAGIGTDYSEMSSYIGTGSTYTLTPHSFDEAAGMYLSEEGEYISWSNVSNTYGQVRPVINLSKDVIAESGDGTSGNPYVIQTSNVDSSMVWSIGDKNASTYDKTKELSVKPMITVSKDNIKGAIVEEEIKDDANWKKLKSGIKTNQSINEYIGDSYDISFDESEKNVFIIKATSKEDSKTYTVTLNYKDGILTYNVPTNEPVGYEFIHGFIIGGVLEEFCELFEYDFEGVNDWIEKNNGKLTLEKNGMEYSVKEYKYEESGEGFSGSISGDYFESLKLNIKDGLKGYTNPEKPKDDPELKEPNSNTGDTITYVVMFSVLALGMGLISYKKLKENKVN